ACPMNMISASGLPRPKTVCVRELARFGHLVQTEPRACTAASLSILSALEGAALSAPKSFLEDDPPSFCFRVADGAWSSNKFSRTGAIWFSASSALRVAHGRCALSLRMRSRVCRAVSSACGNCITAYCEVLRESANDFDSRKLSELMMHQ